MLCDSLWSSPACELPPWLKRTPCCCWGVWKTWGTWEMIYPLGRWQPTCLHPLCPGTHLPRRWKWLNRIRTYGNRIWYELCLPFLVTRGWETINNIKHMDKWLNIICLWFATTLNLLRVDWCEGVVEVPDNLICKPATGNNATEGWGMEGQR